MYAHCASLCFLIFKKFTCRTVALTGIFIYTRSWLILEAYWYVHHCTCILYLLSFFSLFTQSLEWKIMLIEISSSFPPVDELCQGFKFYYTNPWLCTCFWQIKNNYVMLCYLIKGEAYMIGISIWFVIIGKVLKWVPVSLFHPCNFFIHSWIHYLPGNWS